MCRKKAYPSKAKARAAAFSIRRRFKSKQEPYLCPECGKYHLTRT